jgi:hypothetical protein
MPGTKHNGYPARPICFWVAAAMTATQYLGEWIAPFNGRVGAVKVNGRTAGTGGGNTVMDLLKNGTSMYTTTANRPTLAATSTGEFANTNPDTRSFIAGDVIGFQCLSISSTGHANVSYSVDFEPS